MTFCGRELMGERAPEFSPYLSDQIRQLGGQPTSLARDRCLEELRAHQADGKRLVAPLCPEGPAYKRHPPTFGGYPATSGTSPGRAREYRERLQRWSAAQVSRVTSKDVILRSEATKNLLLVNAFAVTP